MAVVYPQAGGIRRRGRSPAGHLDASCAAYAAGRSRRLSVCNCPQAARMSRPRGLRTGEENPASMTIVAKRSMALPELVSYAEPGHGLNGIRFTLAGMPAIRS